MKLTTIKTQQSVVSPDVCFTFRTFSEARHQEHSLATAEARYKFRELLNELESLTPEGTKPNPTTIVKINNLNDRLDLIVATEINSVWIKTYLKSIDGLEIDDVPATVETFLKEAPRDLYAEVLKVIQGQVELTVAEKKD